MRPSGSASRVGFLGWKQPRSKVRAGVWLALFLASEAHGESVKFRCKPMIFGTNSALLH